MSPHKYAKDQDDNSLNSLPYLAKEQNLSDVVENYFDSYLAQHRDHLPKGQLYSLVMDEMEKALLSVMVKTYPGNLTKLSHILGINRNTLRSKLLKYQLFLNSDSKEQ